MANRLTAPRPLYDVMGWAQSYASHDWLGAPASLLNDDRLGRALDAISSRLDEIAAKSTKVWNSNRSVDENVKALKKSAPPKKKAAKKKTPVKAAKKRRG